MNADLEQAWTDTLMLLEPELPRPGFETWLRRSRPVGFIDDMLLVSVPSDFGRRYLEDRCADQLRDRLSARIGRPIALEFVVAGAEDGAPALDGVEAQPQQLREETPADDRSPAPTVFPYLNPKYTFESFVTSPNSQLSFSAAVAVADAPGRMYNPLFIYGGVGLGKTHLLQAIAHRVVARTPQARICYVSCETFVNEITDAIKDRTTVEFRGRYRNVDVLLVDDVQILAGKERTQEEFFHTFNALHEATRQIVLSSDRPPKEIPTLEDRLRSRFEWGLLTDVQPPDLETRIAILRKKAESEHLRVPDEPILFIAERITTNIRELEGALIRLVAYASVHKRPIDLACAEDALHDVLPQAQPKQITIRLIQQKVAEYYDIDMKTFTIRKRTRAVAFPRQVAMYLCRELTDQSLPRIGEEFGGRDHTTVIHAHTKIGSDCASDPALRGTIQILRKRIMSGE
jgi:chromosomal replication initiator protein